LPRALKNVKPEVEISPALSLFALPGDGSIRTRKVAILVADGVDGEAARALHQGLAELGAVPRYVGLRLGPVKTERGDTIEVEVTLETMPSVLFDAVAIMGGASAANTLGNFGHTAEFLQSQYRHAKPILALGAGTALLEKTGVPRTLPSGSDDPGILLHPDGDAAKALPRFVKAIARHRHYEREQDPPAI